MKRIKILFLAALFVMGMTGLADAVNMTGRLGLGFNYQTDALFSAGGLGMSVPAVSAKFGLNPKLSLAGLFGFSYDSYDAGGGNDGSASTFGLGAKIFYTLRDEKQLNFYGGGGVIILVGSQEVQTGVPGGGSQKVSTFAFKIPGYLGAEFFPAGLPNLGLSFETGIELIIGSAEDTDLFKFGTTGGIFTVGVHYYF